jgi:hypothetical protein
MLKSNEEEKNKLGDLAKKMIEYQQIIDTKN